MSPRTEALQIRNITLDACAMALPKDQAMTAMQGEVRRVALLLRGDSFRNSHLQHSDGTCCDGSQHIQWSVAESHTQNLIPALERVGIEVDVVIATYPCSNGRNWTRTLLPLWYGRHLREFRELNRADTRQAGNIAHAIKMAALLEEGRGSKYDRVVIARLDHELALLPCNLAGDTPMDACRAHAEHNCDALTIFPRPYFECAVHSITKCSGIGAARVNTCLSQLMGHKFANQIQRYVGPQPSRYQLFRNMSGSGCPRPQYRKVAGTLYWLHKGNKTREPHSAGCACGPHVARAYKSLTGGLSALVAKSQIPIGGCEVRFCGHIASAIPDAGTTDGFRVAVSLENSSQVAHSCKGMVPRASNVSHI